MAFDPQRFNLYGYARNNPLKFVDPDGERIHLFGDTGWLRTNVLYEMAGGEARFNRYFEVVGDEVRLRPDVNISEANAGVRELAGFVGLDENLIYFAGTDGGVAASLFADSDQERLADEFNGTTPGRGDRGGYVIGTRDRGQGAPQPGLTLEDGTTAFAIIAYNTNAVQFQSGSNPYGIANGAESRGEGGGIVELGEQWLGRRQRIDPVRFFIHESAEKLAFAEQARSGRPLNYNEAHQYAMRREGVVRRALQLTGGFAGGAVDSRVPR